MPVNSVLWRLRHEKCQPGYSVRPCLNETEKKKKTKVLCERRKQTVSRPGELTEICQPLLPFTGIKGVCHHDLQGP